MRLPAINEVKCAESIKNNDNGNRDNIATTVILLLLLMIVQFDFYYNIIIMGVFKRTVQGK
jgi:hypothetical protein